MLGHQPFPVGGPEWGVAVTCVSCRENKTQIAVSPNRSQRRNNFIIQAVNITRWGSAWGAIAMTDTEDSKERREQLLRYCAMERESTDPLALGLLHDIVLELQADLQAVAAKLRRLAEPQPNILK